MILRKARIHILLSALLVVCALGAVPRAAQAVSVQEEIDLGKKIDAQIMKETPLYNDEQAQKEIQEYGHRLAKYVNRPQIPYHFKILKDDELNAFSVPGGYVYFTSHLWDVLRKDERIGVLGHEITHVDQRHVIDAVLKEQKRQTIISILLAAARANDVWGNIASIAEQLHSLKYSRGDEQQADYGSVNLCQKAGYNPAGILLAMYKIKRFQDEAGGEPPKIFSDHPPTKERLQYIEQLLTSKGIPIPPENVQTVNMPDRIGDVVATTPDTVTFTSHKTLAEGDVVWVMREGWDYYYEKRTAVPAARGVVSSVASSVTANIWMIPSPKKVQITNGMGVYAPPSPALDKSVGSLVPISRQAGIGRMRFAVEPKALERFFAVQAVWNKENTALVNDDVGYLVVTNPASDTGYVGITRPEFSYAPMELNSALVAVSDPDQARWVGPIISIGRGGGTIEVDPTRALDANKTYEVLYPGWNKSDSYKKRIVGTAKLQSTSPKIVLKMTSFEPGWSMADVQNGFDIYEQEQEPK
jgi:Zn-dependent protease with chaperone function